jgi:hypothetical protein
MQTELLVCFPHFLHHHTKNFSHAIFWLALLVPQVLELVLVEVALDRFDNFLIA